MKKQNLLSKGPRVSEADESVAERVLAIVDRGLVRGMGQPKPGKMCVEAAVCYAMGRSHSDQPECVDYSVRNFKIDLNDRRGWSSVQARGQGMRALAIAQLGSNKLEDNAFRKQLISIVTSMLAVLLAAEYSRRKPDRAVVRGLTKHLENWQGKSSYASVTSADLAKTFYSPKLVARAGYTGKSAKNRLIAQIGLTALIQAKAEGTKFLKLLLKKRRK